MKNIRHQKLHLTQLIKSHAKELGCDLVGICAAKYDPKAEEILRQFITRKRHGKMAYLEDYKKRVDPTQLLPKAKSIIVIALNYYQKKPALPKDYGKIARYAYGRDYHKVIKNILKKLAVYIKEIAPTATCKPCVDSVPLFEKHYAVQAGLGFIGKNTTLITKEYGSFVLLGELITDLDLKTDKPVTGTCGTCTRCLDSCPTKALKNAYEMNANACISYLTIENKDSIPQKYRSKLNNWLYGCDICQEVCPYNQKFARQTKNPDFNQAIAGHHLDLKKLLKIKSHETFTKKFAGSALMRPKEKGLKRNAKALIQGE